MEFQLEIDQYVVFSGLILIQIIINKGDGSLMCETDTLLW